jgi:glutamate-1-semialdehyde 2,1-aminomutase/spore coat polysaccharide biosynthesis protein SpsF
MTALVFAGTFSRDHRLWGGDNFEPKYIVKGDGCRVLGSDGKWYTDWVGGLGPNILGYTNTAFNARLHETIHNGVAFSLESHLEHEAADALAYVLGNTVPGWKGKSLGVRFGLSGSDACNMAIRLARAVTGKMHILSGGYHGWGSDFISMTPPAHGIIPEESGYVHPITLGDRASLLPYENRDDIAAIIVEHPATEIDDLWYMALRDFCDDHEALLIIDEVVTGFRFAMGGACERYNIYPDLCTYGKALGNGIPVSALVGYRDYLDWFARVDPVFCSSTFNGNALSSVAALTFLEMWDNSKINHIYEVGNVLRNGLEIAGWNVIGHDPRSVVMFDNDYAKAFFIQGMKERNILMNRPNFPTLAHVVRDAVDTVNAAQEIHDEMVAMGKDKLEQVMADYLPRVLFRNR